MPITTALPVNEILNRVAVEVGLSAVQDPFGSSDNNFIQLRYLLNIAGEELAIMNDWNILIARASIDTDVDSGGAYALPSDFLRITNQTAWEHNNRVPVPQISAQDWAGLNGRDFSSDTIYPKYRLQDGLFTIYPQPAPPNLLISYEYISSNWVIPSGAVDEVSYNNFITSRGAKLFTDKGLAFRVLENTALGSNEIASGSDIPVYDRTLLTRYLKLKWLQAKGFDSNNAQQDFDQIYEMLVGTNKGSKVLRAGIANFGVPLINPLNNLSDTNYGL